MEKKPLMTDQGPIRPADVPVRITEALDASKRQGARPASWGLLEGDLAV